MFRDNHLEHLSPTSDGPCSFCKGELLSGMIRCWTCFRKLHYGKATIYKAVTDDWNKDSIQRTLVDIGNDYRAPGLNPVTAGPPRPRWPGPGVGTLMTFQCPTDLPVTPILLEAPVNSAPWQGQPHLARPWGSVVENRRDIARLR